MTTFVLIIEKRANDQQLAATKLKEAGFLVECVDTVKEAELSIYSTLPDLIILDWILPRQSVLALIKKIRTDGRTHDVPIIMMSAQNGEEDKVQALDAGTDDYVTTPFSPGELVARIRAILRRRAPHLSGETIQIGTLILNPATHHIFADGQPIDLAKMDFRILNFFMTHPGRLYSRAQLLDEIWGDHVYVHERTIDVHIRNLRAALAASDNADRIETIRGGGYRFRGNSPTQVIGPSTNHISKRRSTSLPNAAINQSYAFA